jgi:hypothetical protein
MEIEFHYYMTYLIAARAGFSPVEATIIAHSSQGVDDNHVPISVNPGTAFVYENVLSQTMDITRPHHDTRIYPIFHFIPGDPKAPSAARKDGKVSQWTTTPNSALAHAMIDSALTSKNLYRIGASAHAYCDTWAHQNFLGIEDDFNEMPIAKDDQTTEFLDKVAKIGHGPAQHLPDLVGLTWTDGRLISANEKITNRVRFVEAARHLFGKLYWYKHPGSSVATAQQEEAALVSDLYMDIGGPDDKNLQVANRIGRYHRRALSPTYGATAIPIYDPNAWTNAALNQAEGNVFDWLHNVAIKKAGDYGDLIRGGMRAQCTWRDVNTYKQTDWYEFQEAIRAHLDECWSILVNAIPDAAKQAV